MKPTENVLEIRDLVKDFPGVRAVNDVSFDIKRNTVHCLVGENGAGKSTLIKMLTGAYTRTSGQILLNGEEYNPHSTRDAKQKGISTLFQELNVVDQLTVEENLTLGMEDTTFGFVRHTEKINKMVSVLNSIEPSIKPNQLVSSLSVAKKQIVEIAKAVAAESDIIIMDEPTAAISESEIARLFTIIKGLREKNVTVIYISHRLDEIFELGDYVTVMRDGKHIDTKPVAEIKDRSELIKMMIGKTVFEQYTPREGDCPDTILEVKHLSNHRLNDISFEIHAGEIAGFYGLVGAGKTELARAIYGVDEYEGEITLQGQKTPSRSRQGDCSRHCPGTRRKTIPGLVHHPDHPWQCACYEHEEDLSQRIHQRCDGTEYHARIRGQVEDRHQQHRKGGCQAFRWQPAEGGAFAKCLFADADLLMLDEPTRGIDVGAKSEIYSLIRQLSKEGKTIIIFSSELPEVMNICDSIYLLYDGSLKVHDAEWLRCQQREILHIVTGGDSHGNSNKHRKH